MNCIAVFTTLGSRADAQALAHALVARRLAACAQISEIESVYRWDGEVQQATEWRLLVKTARERYAEVERAIVELHPYELPAIYALDWAAAYPPFAAWVADETGTGVTAPT